MKSRLVIIVCAGFIFWQSFFGDYNFYLLTLDIDVHCSTNSLFIDVIAYESKTSCSCVSWSKPSRGSSVKSLLI